ncbi:hypothetical protein J2T16_004858 [Paenibacillus intestini]|nr:hypothetical protein [Paenibacillus intestini]
MRYGKERLTILQNVRLEWTLSKVGRVYRKFGRVMLE